MIELNCKFDFTPKANEISSWDFQVWREQKSCQQYHGRLKPAGFLTEEELLKTPRDSAVSGRIYPDFAAVKHFPCLHLSEPACDGSNGICEQLNRDKWFPNGKESIRMWFFLTPTGKQNDKSFSDYGPNEATSAHFVANSVISDKHTWPHAQISISKTFFWECSLF